MASVPSNDLRAFHELDRQVFRRLVINLRRNVQLSMDIIALWLWLEAVGYPSILEGLRVASDRAVNALATEAVVGLFYILSDIPPDPMNNIIELTSLLTAVPISFFFLFDNRGRARAFIPGVINRTLARAFEDIVEEVRVAQMYHQLVPQNQNAQAIGEPANSRSVLLHFSDDYTMTELELDEYFSRNYGDVVESIHLEGTNERATSARVVFYVEETVDEVLNGVEAAAVKHIINGHDVWFMPV